MRKYNFALITILFCLTPMIASASLEGAMYSLRTQMSTVSASRDGWNDVAKSVECKFMNVEVVCSNKEEHQTRLRTRTTTIAGLTEPTWKEIQEREYHPWNQDRILIETSGKDIETCFGDLLSALKEKLGVIK